MTHSSPFDFVAKSLLRRLGTVIGRARLVQVQHLHAGPRSGRCSKVSCAPATKVLGVALLRQQLSRLHPIGGPQSGDAGCRLARSECPRGGVFAHPAPSAVHCVALRRRQSSLKPPASTGGEPNRVQCGPERRDRERRTDVPALSKHLPVARAPSYNFNSSRICQFV